MNKPAGSKSSVVLFLPDLNGGGAERAVVNLLKSWVEIESDFQPILVLRRKIGPYLDEIPKEVEVIEIGTARCGLTATVLTVFLLSRLLKQFRPLAVVSFLSHPSVAAAKFIARSKCILLASIQNPVEMSGRDLAKGMLGKFSWMIRRQIIAISFRWTDRFLPITIGIGKELQSRFSIDEERIDVVPNSVEIPQHLESIPEPPALAALRAVGVPTLVTAGRLVRQKGYDILIEAMRILRDGGVEFKLVVLGDGELKQSLVSQVKKNNLQSSIFFLGFQKSPGSYFANADLFVLASRYEGFGNVIIEALACGCPVVSTDAPYGPSDILMGNEYGVLVPTERPDLLAEAINGLLDRPDQRAFYSLRGQVRARGYRREVVFKKFMGALERGIEVDISIS